MCLSSLLMITTILGIASCSPSKNPNIQLSITRGPEASAESKNDFKLRFAVAARMISAVQVADTLGYNVLARDLVYDEMEPSDAGSSKDEGPVPETILHGATWAKEQSMKTPRGPPSGVKWRGYDDEAVFQSWAMKNAVPSRRGRLSPSDMLNPALQKNRYFLTQISLWFPKATNKAVSKATDLIVISGGVLSPDDAMRLVLHEEQVSIAAENIGRWGIQPGEVTCDNKLGPGFLQFCQQSWNGNPIELEVDEHARHQLRGEDVDQIYEPPLKYDEQSIDGKGKILSVKRSVSLVFHILEPFKDIKILYRALSDGFRGAYRRESKFRIELYSTAYENEATGPSDPRHEQPLGSAGSDQKPGNRILLGYVQVSPSGRNLESLKKSIEAEYASWVMRSGQDAIRVRNRFNFEQRKEKDMDKMTEKTGFSVSETGRTASLDGTSN